MKKMIYQPTAKIEVLATGYCFGLLYYIFNLGTHPTAYIKIPKNHKYYEKEYDDIDICVHGGITYSRDYLYLNEKDKIEGWFIGWDYAHCYDFMGYYNPKDNGLYNLKKWTTEEIYKEVREACYQIQKIGGEKIDA